MRLIYFTPKKFQFFSADNTYVLKLAASFAKILKNNFFLVFIEKGEDKLADNEVNLNLKFINKFNFFYLPYFYFIFWTPYFLVKQQLKSKEDIFFLGDQRLLFILIFWRKILRYDYQICADCHMFIDNKINRFVFGHCDYLITTSEKLRNLIIAKTKINPAIIKTVYGGTDVLAYEAISKSEARKRLNLPLDKKLIGYIGLFKTMGMEKGIDTMMKSLSLLDESFAMVFVGARDGEVEKYEKMAENFKVKNRCLIIEKKDFDQVAVYQQAMDALVIPYPDKPHFRDFGFPMKVYDYMASGRPIVYSRLELVEEVVGDYGFSFTPDDPKDLANCLEKIFSRYSEAEAKASGALNTVKEYSWDKKAENIINFLMTNI